MTEEENKANGRSEGEHRGGGEEEEEERKETEIIKQKEDGISLSLSSSSTMKPWEQHAGVIVMPRFDYNAPSSLLQYSRSGFLITCPIKREKSATKEAMSILGKYVGYSTSCSSECIDYSNQRSSSKRRKTCMEDMDEKIEVAANNNDALRGSLSPLRGDASGDRTPPLSLVKLTRSGLLLFTFPRIIFFDTISILSNINHSLESGSMTPPQWCHRIFPIQATCNLNEKELRLIVSKLVRDFMDDKLDKVSRPLKFAVGYNRRGIEETKMKNTRDTSNPSPATNLLDRNTCFAVVAAAVKDAVSDSVVDLTSPELCVLVEMLPLSGIPSGSLVAAVSVLPQNLVSTKPRLCIKPLISDAKAGVGKH